MTEKGAKNLFVGSFDSSSCTTWLIIFCLLTILGVFLYRLAALNILGVFLEQSMSHQKPSLLLITVLTSGIFFTLMYKSVLISQLTKPKQPKQLNYINDVPLFGSDFRVFVWDPSSLADYVKANHAGLVEQGYFYLHEDMSDKTLFDKFLDGSMAYFDDPIFIFGTYLNPEFNPNVDCEFKPSDFYISKEPYMNSFTGPLASKQYAYREEVGLQLGRMVQHGFNTNERDFPADTMYYPAPKVDSTVCRKSDSRKSLKFDKTCVSIKKKNVPSLSLLDLQQLFMVYFAGNFIALVVFACEFCSWRSSHSKA